MMRDVGARHAQIGYAIAVTITADAFRAAIAAIITLLMPPLRH